MSLHPVVACGIHPCLAVDPTPSIHCTAWPALCIADPAASVGSVKDFSQIGLQALE